MRTTQTQKEGSLRVLHSDSPFAPPKDDACFINNLPIELLSRIFGFGPPGNSNRTKDDNDEVIGCWKMGEVLDDDGGEEDGEWSDTTGSECSSSNPPLRKTPFAVFVSHVCRHWRHVALSTPSLWTTIAFPQLARPPYKLQSMLLERSQGLPVDIYVQGQFDDSSNRLSSMLIPEIHRWRTMHISVWSYDCVHDFLCAISDLSIPAAPRLTTVELYYFRDIDDVEYLSMSKHFTLFRGLAPSLSRIVVWGVYVDWSQPWIASASNLTDIEFGCHPEEVRPSWTQISTILRSAPGLRRLCLRVSAPTGDPALTAANSTDPIQLPRLTDLILAIPSPPQVLTLLQKLYLPALRNLDLGFDPDHDCTDLVHELVRPAISSSFGEGQRLHSLLSGLESLRIYKLPCHIDCVEMLYSELENLTTLNISLEDLPPRFLDILGTPCTLPGRSDVWLPRLTTLYVSGTTGKLLCNIVQKRKDAGVPLRSLYMEQACELLERDITWLRTHVKTVGFFDELELGFD